METKVLIHLWQASSKKLGVARERSSFVLFVFLKVLIRERVISPGRITSAHADQSLRTEVHRDHLHCTQMYDQS